MHYARCSIVNTNMEVSVRAAYLYQTYLPLSGRTRTATLTEDMADDLLQELVITRRDFHTRGVQFIAIGVSST